MQISSINIQRGALGLLAAGVFGGLAAVTIALPTAAAQPQCTAAGLSNAIGTVATATGGYLAAYPGANDAVTNAGALPLGDAENAIRPTSLPIAGVGRPARHRAPVGQFAAAVRCGRRTRTDRKAVRRDGLIDVKSQEIHVQRDLPALPRGSPRV